MGTAYFFHGKYEAKNDGNGIPESVATSWPWGDISQLDAITACASIGKGYHLITNDEWMTVASNIANVDSNWSGGTVGSGHLYRGHSDNSPNYACEADVDDTKAYVEGGNCNGLAAGGGEDDETTQRRTHSLSTGEIIWDISGNLKEWTSYFNDTDKPSAGGGWMQYNQPVVGSSTLPLSDLIPTSAVKSFWNDSWSTANSIGRYNSGANGAGGAMARGERWSGGDYAGVFTADLFYTQDNSANTPGFRCTVSVP